MDYSYGNATTDNYANTLNYDPVGGNSLGGSFWKFSSASSNVDARLQGKLHTGALEHNLLIGYSYLDSVYKADQTAYAPAAVLPTVVMDQLPSTTPGSFTGVPTSSGLFNWWTEDNAVYAQDLVTVVPTLKVLLGARYDRIRQHTLVGGSFASGVASVDDLTQTYTHTSPRVGLVYQGIPSTSLYGVYSTSFIPNSGMTRSHENLPPEQGTLKEAGIKYAFSQRLTANVAVFDLTRKNISFCDPTDPNCFYLIVAGETRSRGVELDLNGQVVERLRLNVAASFLKAWVAQPDPGGNLTAGNELVGAPRRTLNVFGVYSLDRGRRWELGGGVYYASQAQADDANSFTLPEILEIDVMAAYRFAPNGRFQLDIKNLTNRHNVASDGSALTFGQPLSAYATLHIGF
ncbi:MAG TPA: TonB-dependent receptor [Steroidobacteraceae bacterium]|nr:TonB-dependent receptor [Steroidobacteraceae bacterium]